MIEKIDIDQLLERMTTVPVMDVRSPSEYMHARIPGAFSLPLFTDEERRVVGTAYKQESREKAIRIGLDYFGGKMGKMIDQAEEQIRATGSRNVIVHCWRGGMRSAGVAWLLDLYGFKVSVVTGGYKAFRKWALDQLQQDHDLAVLGGYTGSGKTEILGFLHALGERTIDLEGIAHHKGSAFGAIGQPPQPSQEMFENLFACELRKQGKDGRRIWIEDESQRIGHVNIPATMWACMRSKPVHFIEVPFEARLDHIMRHYGKLNRGDLAAAILRIQKRLGGLETKTALALLAEGDLRECFRILLTYYDKLYGKSLTQRPHMQVNRMPCSVSGSEEAAQNILKNIKIEENA